MRRIILLVTVAALLAAMIVASALPAFAHSEAAQAPKLHFTYGHCASDAAKASGPNKPFTQTTDPYDPRIDKGNPHPGIACLDTKGGGS